MDKFKKLSAAMKFGATLTKQCYSMLFNMDQKTARITETCALGAVHHAVFGEDVLKEKECSLNRQIPQLDSKISECPQCGVTEPYGPYLSPANLTHFITHLNNNHKWTREQIADWLESIGY